MKSDEANIMGTMNERESMEAFNESAKMACSAAYEMARNFQDQEWENLAVMLEAMRVNGMKLAQMKAMNKFETAMALNMKTGLIGQ